MEYGWKIMEDGLVIKDSCFLVDQLYLIHRKAGIKQNKGRTYRKACLLIMVVDKVDRIKPESR